MKKLLTLLLLCFISTITFANKGFATKNNFNVLSNEIKENITLTHNSEISYDEKQAACTATYSVAIYVDGMYRTTISRSHTYVSDITTGNCGIAMAFAQQEAEDAVVQYMELNNLVAE